MGIDWTSAHPGFIPVIHLFRYAKKRLAAMAVTRYDTQDYPETSERHRGGHVSIYPQAFRECWRTVGILVIHRTSSSST
jgi:hypothetical protein